MPNESDQRKPNPDECLIPPPVQPEALEQYLLKRAPFDGADEVRQYVEGQSPEEEVTYLERITSERVAGRDHDIWDVHTSGERYWVITNPTNLYSQRLFPSADYTLSFHVGLMSRVMSHREPGVVSDDETLLASAWRRWHQAGEALDRAHESEDFQAVGMRCRECLLALARDLGDSSMVINGGQAPQSGNFIAWSDLIANAFASGASSERVRGYLKGLARETWQLVSWLTHAQGATPFDAEMAIDATNNTLGAFSMAVVRFRRGAPTRCPECASYRISNRYVEDADGAGTYAPACEACGWANTGLDLLDADEEDPP